VALLNQSAKLGQRGLDLRGQRARCN
jgi:hypothetical protein